MNQSQLLSPDAIKWPPDAIEWPPNAIQLHWVAIKWPPDAITFNLLVSRDL